MKKEPITGNYDVIVIGSGIGGMSTAAFLAKEGKKVLVLERHYEPGGFTHTFKRHGYEWDVGVHYIGDVHREHTVSHKLFKYINDTELEWAEMGDVYEKVFFGDEVFEFKKGAKAFKEQMKTYFPTKEDHKAIDDYLQLVYKAQGYYQLLFVEKTYKRNKSKLLGRSLRKRALKYNRPTLEVLQEITNNKKLIAVLLGQLGDYGTPPSKSSFLIHALVVKHYLNGGCYPVGGSQEIFNSVAPTITKAGGDIYIRAEVEEILVENNRAVGVKLKGGEEIRANKVVSSAGIYNTYQRLLPNEIAQKHGLTDQLKKLTRSSGHLNLFVGLKHSKSELNLGKANYWIYPDRYDHDANINEFMADPEKELPVAYVSFPTAKAPNWEERYPGLSTLEIITVADYKWFEEWEDKKWKKRGEDYEDKKEYFAQRMLENSTKKSRSLEGK